MTGTTSYVPSVLGDVYGNYRLSILAGGAVLLSPLVLIIFFILRALALSTWRMTKVHILRTDTYDHLPRPSWSDWQAPFFGHFGLIRKMPPAEAHLQWMDELKSDVYVYRGLFYDNRLLIGDARGIMYILSQAQCYDYPKPGETRKFLTELLGEGILSAEGDVHRRQRKIVSPAFSVSSVRAFTPTFFKYANSLARIWEGIIDGTQGPATEPFILGQSEWSARASRKQEPVLDVSFWLAKVTLDIIGVCAFDTDFKSLEKSRRGGDDDEEGAEDEKPQASGGGGDLATNLSAIFKQLGGLTILDFVRLYLQTQPGLGWIRSLPSARRDARRGLYNEMHKSALEMIARKREQITQEIEALGAKGNVPSKALFDEDLDAAATASGAKDLLHLTMRANMASDVKQTEKLDDTELVGQITSFLLAGHETTSTMTMWALYALAGHRDVVDRLRSEINETFADREEIDYDELNEMHYLDCVAKELLRCYSPVTSTVRIADKDDAIPLGRSYPTRDGKGTFDTLVIKKGQDIIIPCQVLNKSKSIWGPTARDFDPSRWFPENLPASARDSGMPLHLATFISGPRGCVGNRFAIAEFKVLLVTFIRNFNFERIPGWELDIKQEIVTRCKVKGQEKFGSQMPLRVTRVGARGGQQVPSFRTDMF